MTMTMTSLNCQQHDPTMQDMQRAQATCRRSSSSSWTSSSTSCSWASSSPPAPLPASSSSSQDGEVSSSAASRPPSSRLFAALKRQGGTGTGASCRASRTCQGMSTQDRRELWRCMLELQRQYGCYNSTRIDLAVHEGDAGLDLMPNPFIIDTLNGSLIDLPTQGWATLDRCLRNTTPQADSMRLGQPKSSKSRPRFWSNS
ncbi:hypothetical protein E4U21_005796 [Claviceps maximensis]|nr:hypothetical protein E4U21_005796 [Claviceps maximensis]